MSGKTRPCEICDELIDPERVEAVPETRLCTTHARQIQKHGGEFLLTASPERTSKPGSMKRNYGGVDIQKQRNTQAINKLRAEYDEEQNTNQGKP
ncbi:MAG: TraR/DksA C4-type zinc finger protein [Isosphaeraceae bacterium]|nr:TraR/DksA C4-type zinc finger protein [Isosphaeraceae bacterium]